MHRVTPTDATNWELGNELLHHVMDNLLRMAKEVEIRNPELAGTLRSQHKVLIPWYRLLTGEKALL